MNCKLFSNAIIWIIEHISNQWLDRGEASELQMKQEDFIYLRISNRLQRWRSVSLAGAGGLHEIIFEDSAPRLYYYDESLIYQRFVHDESRKWEI